MAGTRWVWLDRAGARRLGWLGVFLVAALAASWAVMVAMPGHSYRGPLPPATNDVVALAAELRADLQVLAGDIGERNVFDMKQLRRAADFLAGKLESAGYAVERPGFEAAGEWCENLVAERRGTSRPDEIVVVGGHYDSVGGCPGANDNGTGAVAVLALARAFAAVDTARTLRFVEFVNEEPPFFWTEHQGSLVYARRCAARGERVTAMLSLETLGCYRDEAGTQRYPTPLFRAFYPSRGDFVTFIGNVRSRALVHRCVATFRATAAFPSEGAAAWGGIPGIGWSDHWSFWQCGYPALMVTDTAVYRYEHYHQPTDTPDRVDYDRFARVVAGLRPVLAELADGRP